MSGMTVKAVVGAVRRGNGSSVRYKFTITVYANELRIFSHQGDHWHRDYDSAVLEGVDAAKAQADLHRTAYVIEFNSGQDREVYVPKNVLPDTVPNGVL